MHVFKMNLIPKMTISIQLTCTVGKSFLYRMWRVVALSGCMNRLFTDFTVHYFVVFYLIIKCTGRIARELYTSTKQETCQGCGWGMIPCASCSLRLLFPWHALKQPVDSQEYEYNSQVLVCLPISLLLHLVV